MIALIKDLTVAHGWLTEGQVINMVAVAESTPGPIAVNMATFVGSSQGGALGALVATLGVVLPSFVIILIISAVLKNILKTKLVRAVLSGIRPATVGLILGTGISFFLSILFGIGSIGGGFAPDAFAVLIFVIIVAISLFSKVILKKKISPIFLILISAVLGMIFYS